MSEVESIELSMNDQNNMRTFLQLVYSRNPSLVNNWPMNESVFVIVMEMVQEVVSCSNRMDFVPQPGDLIGGRGGVHYTKKVLESIAKRVEENQRKPNREIYFSCRDFVAANYRTALEMAGSGL